MHAAASPASMPATSVPAPRARRVPDAATLALVAIVAGGAALRFATLGDRSLWVDEGATAHLMRSSFGHMLDVWRDTEDTPPLYYLLAWVWARVFGTGEVGLRSLSALLGTATIPVAYVVTRRLATRRAGLIAAAIVAVSAMDVWFSQDARTYALVVLAGGLSFWAFLRAVDVPSRGRLAAWTGACLLAVLSHYFAIYLVAAEAVWLLVVHPGRRRATALAVAAPAAIFLALIPIALSQRSSQGSGPFLIASSGPRRALQLPAEYVVAFQPPAQVVVSVLAFLPILVAVWLLARRADERERRGALPAVVVGGAAVLGPVVMAVVPGFDYLLARHTSSALVPLVAAVSIGLSARRAGLLGAAAVAWLVGWSLAIDVVTADHPKFDHDDWRSAARALPPTSGRAVLATNPDSGVGVLDLYLPGSRRLKGAPGPVSEIDLVGLPPPTRHIGQSPRPPRPPSPPAPAGFRLVERRNAKTFTLVRYRASRPVAVSRAQVWAMGLTPGEDPGLLSLPPRPSS